MRQLNAKQKKLLKKFVADYHKGSGGNYPDSVDDINPFLWVESELDYRYQDGTIAPSDEIEQLERISTALHGYASSMNNDNGWREANRKGEK